MSDTESLISIGLRSAFWQEYLLPRLQERAKSVLESLASSHDASDDIKRGKFQAYREIINLPQQELSLLHRDAEERDRDVQVQQQDEFRARSGFRTPYKAAPEPGETKAADDGGGPPDNPAA